MDASSEIEATPMMAQYLAIRAEAPADSLLFYRMGDFFELFFEDAVKAAAALDIALTKRGKHLGADIPMCGVPYHSYESYLARLIKRGFNVAICEQTEDPAEAKRRGHKAVVARAIIRVVTPGTITEDSLLDPARTNHLAALSIMRGGAEAAIAWLDMSTGDLFVRTTAPGEARLHAAALSLSELIIADEPPADAWKATIEELGRSAAIARQPSLQFDSRAGQRRLLDAYAVQSIDGFGNFSRAEISAMGALLAYVALTQVGRMPALKPPKRADASPVMLIDPATRTSLELFLAQSGGREGSLVAAIDRTRTGAGARALAERLSAPLTDAAAINGRLDAVAWLLNERECRDAVREQLKAAPDMARALSRLALGRGGPRDLAAIRDGLIAARDIAHVFAASGRLGPVAAELAAAARALECRDGEGFSDLVRLLSDALGPDLPSLARDGGFVAKDFDPGLDSVRLLRDESRRVIAGLEAKYRAEADAKSLKIRHNNVLGYFIETPPSSADKLTSPEFAKTFIHRQTIASAVRFTTTELAELDAKIARARDEALAREVEIFDRLAEAVKARARDIGAAADALAAIDVAAGLAELAREEDYVRPIVDESFAFTIEGGRHPVVEQALRRASGAFIANDCRLSDDAGPKIKLVTGPNMAGKSTYLRQNALIAILAQAGAFVPAQTAHIGVADRIFSRVGAADDLARGRSTFMVEMVETAAILNQAGPRALVILDEIGRGTSTFDGLSIAWAAVEHLHDENRCRALFATHYHELTALSRTLPRLANVSMRVREWKGDVVFLHEIGEGPADRSYGVAVAKLAGLPKSVVKRAESVLALLESQRGAAPALGDLPLFATVKSEPKAEGGSDDRALAEALVDIEPDRLSPRDALDALYRLKSLAQKGAP